MQFNREGRFRFLKSGSGSSGSAFGSWENGSDGSGFRFRFGSGASLRIAVVYAVAALEFFWLSFAWFGAWY